MRVPTKPLNQYPIFLRPFFWLQKKHYGQVLTSGLVWARVPRLFMGVARLYGALDRKSSPLSPELRSLLTVRVSQINWCSFCVDINSANLLKRDGSREKLDALENWRESDLFDEKEKIAFEYAEAITYSDKEVTEAIIERLKTFFDDDALVELTGLVAFQNMSSKFNAALDIAPQGFCKMPSKPTE